MKAVFDASQAAQEKAGMGNCQNWIAPFHEEGRGPRGVGDGFGDKALWSEPLNGSSLPCTPKDPAPEFGPGTDHSRGEGGTCENVWCEAGGDGNHHSRMTPTLPPAVSYCSPPCLLRLTPRAGSLSALPCHSRAVASVRIPHLRMGERGVASRTRPALRTFSRAARTPAHRRGSNTHPHLPFPHL